MTGFIYPTLKNQEIGSIHKQEVKCGKSNCHCANGKPHKAYYHFFRKNDLYSQLKLVKEYVKKDDVKRLKALLHYMKNKNNFIKIDGEWFLYAGENMPLNPLPPLLKRLHVIKKRADRKKRELEEQTYKMMYGENYKRALEIEKKLYRSTKYGAKEPRRLNQMDEIKLYQELSEIMLSHSSTPQSSTS